MAWNSVMSISVRCRPKWVSALHAGQSTAFHRIIERISRQKKKAHPIVVNVSRRRACHSVRGSHSTPSIVITWQWWFHVVAGPADNDATLPTIMVSSEQQCCLTIALKCQTSQSDFSDQIQYLYCVIWASKNVFNPNTKNIHVQSCKKMG